MHELVPFFRRTERRGWERLSAESPPPPPPLHLSHTFFPGMGECVCGTGEENSLTSSLVPSFPPSFPPFLPQTTHFYMNSFIFLPSVSFLSPSSSTFILSPRVFLSRARSLSLALSIPHSAIPLSFVFFFVFCHGQGRENEQPESQERRGWRKEEREQGGELCPAEKERDGCSTCRDSAHCTRSSCPCDGSSRQELSMREQNAKKKKRPTPNGAAAERKPIHPCFFFISGPGAQNYLSYKLVQSIFRP